jgi:hypothetical protein
MRPAFTDEAWHLIDTIPRAISEIEGDRLDQQAMEAVVSIMAGCPRQVFWYLDEKPGAIGYEINGREWHYRLRTVRNHTVMGKRLLAGLTPTN